MIIIIGVYHMTQPIAIIIDLLTVVQKSRRDLDAGRETPTASPKIILSVIKPGILTPCIL